MHTGEKPHLCPHCSYRSARRDNLRSHVRRVHKKENLYQDTFSPRAPSFLEASAGQSFVATATRQDDDEDDDDDASAESQFALDLELKDDVGIDQTSPSH